jgi:hypothetical protein
MKKIKTVDVSLLHKLERGEISLKDAARGFCKCGWTNFVDTEATKRYLNIAKENYEREKSICDSL